MPESNLMKLLSREYSDVPKTAVPKVKSRYAQDKGLLWFSKQLDEGIILQISIPMSLVAYNPFIVLL